MVQFAWNVAPFDQTLSNELYRKGMSLPAHHYINIPLYTETYSYKIRYEREDNDK